MNRWLADVSSFVADLFSNDKNIWTIGLIAAGAVLAFMIAKSAVMAVLRRIRRHGGDR